MGTWVPALTPISLRGENAPFHEVGGGEKMVPCTETSPVARFRHSLGGQEVLSWKTCLKIVSEFPNWLRRGAGREVAPKFCTK